MTQRSWLYTEGEEFVIMNHSVNHAVSIPLYIVASLPDLSGIPDFLIGKIYKYIKKLNFSSFRPPLKDFRIFYGQRLATLRNQITFSLDVQSTRMGFNFHDVHHTSIGSQRVN